MSELTTIRKKETNTDFEVRSLDKIYSETPPSKGDLEVVYKIPGNRYTILELF